jgi:hypothetical protein
MRGGILIAVMGIIGITIVNSVRTGVDTSGWTTGEIALTALFGLMIAAGVIMEIVGGIGK